MRSPRPTSRFGARCSLSQTTWLPNEPATPSTLASRWVEVIVLLLSYLTLYACSLTASDAREPQPKMRLRKQIQLLKKQASKPTW